MEQSDKIRLIVDANSKLVNAKDFKFFNVDFLNSLATVSENEACSCQECKKNLDTLLTLAENYPELINGGKENKLKFENDVDKVVSHLIKVHGYTKKNWFKPLYALYGFLIGAAASLISVLFFDFDRTQVLLILSCLMLTGYIYGAVKDNRQTKNGKIL